MLLSFCDWLLILGRSYDLHVDCGKLARGIAVERFWIVDLFVLKMFIGGFIVLGNVFYEKNDSDFGLLIFYKINNLKIQIINKIISAASSLQKVFSNSSLKSNLRKNCILQGTVST